MHRLQDSANSLSLRQHFVLFCFLLHFIVVVPKYLTFHEIDVFELDIDLQQIAFEALPG